MNPKFIELWELTKTYPAPGGPVSVVKDFTLNVREGEFVCLIGHSGCGKSTVLSMVAGLTEISNGGVTIDGREIDGPGLDRGMIFQAPCLLPWMTALENVMLAVDQVSGDLSRVKRKAIAHEHLERVGLGDSAHVRPKEMSGGMRQRVGIARAFALSPKVLLLDEPFGMLDCITRMELQDALLDLWRDSKLTGLMVTHDVDEAIFLADRVVMMTNGPNARVGEILEVDFPRPRVRQDLIENEKYYECREALIGFLESQEHAPALAAGTA